jgi:hypothetical protein
MVAWATYLLAPGASPANAIPLGMIAHAERAHVGEAAASDGSTIYEGDRLSTESSGVMRINSSTLTLQLGGQANLVLRRLGNSEGKIRAELASGTLVFSVAPTGSFVVAANDALVRPAAKAPTVAHIRVVNRKELRIYAQRGTLEFSYHGETEAIPEGKTYRVLLDPSETEAVAALASEEDKKKPATHHPAFLFVAIAAAAGVAIPVLLHALESPDRPGP